MAELAYRWARTLGTGVGDVMVSEDLSEAAEPSGNA